MVYKKINHGLRIEIFVGSQKIILDRIKYIIFTPGTLNTIVTTKKPHKGKRKVVIKYKVCRAEITNSFSKVSNV